MPDVVDYIPPVAELPIDGNSSLGDCTAAAAAHIETAFSLFGQGSPVVPTNDDVIRFYSGSTGYKPGQPSTDQGGDMATVLKFWQAKGMAGHKLAAYFAIDPSDFDELRAAVYLFGAAYVGCSLPQSAEDAFDAGKVWDYTRKGSTILGGHCVAVHKVVKGGNITISSWGGTAEVTPAFWTHYCDEIVGVVSQEWVKDGATPEGLNVAAANAGFQQLTGRPGPFTGAPTPAPVPAPVPPPKPGPVPAPTDGAVALLTSIQGQIGTFLNPVHGR